ncbi:MAG TPA: flagellar basal body-associated FliL family protein, partial [Treponemataceae bacterium]|nr:flagellar basal body-associated FliL family protein [Treponemataceae bacterium]
TPTELSARLVELKDFLRTFFTRKTAAELKNEDKIKIEIRNAINDNILSKSKIKDVRFTQYDIVEQ